MVRRLLGRWWPVIVTLVVVGLVALPAIFYDEPTPENPAFVYEPTTITDYRADFTVDDDGDLAVTETLVVDVPTDDRHGIFRFFDITDPVDPHARRVPHDITVTRDGEPDGLDLSWREDSQIRVARVGSADVTLDPGSHTYVIGYRIDNVLTKAGDGGAQLYWDLIPGGWQQPISHAVLTVHLPTPAHDVHCAVGWGSTGGCTASGTRDLAVEVSDLAPFTPVTLRAGLDLTPARAGGWRPWSIRWDEVLGRSWTWTGGAALATLAAGLLGWRLSRGARERTPAFPLVFAPPDGIGPAQAAYLLQEEVGQRELVATIMYAAQQGVARLDRSGDRWTIRSDGRWTGLDPVSRGVGNAFGSDRFTADPADRRSGKVLETALTRLQSGCATWATKQGLMRPSGVGERWVGAVIAGVATIVLAIVNPFGCNLLAAIPGAYLIAMLGVFRTGAGTVRTEAGRLLWSQLGGFRRTLATASAEARFDFSAREETYPELLPWAVAFGVADRWAEKYRVETGREPPEVAYLPAGDGVGGAAATRTATESLTAGFSATVASAIGAYAAYQASLSSSSSSSGSSSGSGSFSGGFSGGGGGGGGGGGSW